MSCRCERNVVQRAVEHIRDWLVQSGRYTASTRDLEDVLRVEIEEVVSLVSGKEDRK